MAEPIRPNVPSWQHRSADPPTKPVELTHSIPRFHIRLGAVEIGKSLGMKAIRFELYIADGSRMTLEAVRPNTAAAQQFVDSFGPAAQTS